MSDSISAFGVDHGSEISKAGFRMPGQFSQLGNAVKGAKNSFQAGVSPSGGVGGARRAGGPGRFSPGAFGAGQKTRQAGAALNRNKGALGMGAAGGAGIGAGGYAAGRKNSRNSMGQIR